jgi:hypothetical protein
MWPTSGMAADSPFAGTWKVLLQLQQSEVNLWLLKIDKDGTEVEVVAGVSREHKAAKAAGIKGSEKSLSFNLEMPPNQGFTFALLPPKKDKETVLGTVIVGANVLPVWLEKTDQSEIDPKSASQKIGGFAALEAALKKEGEERIKGLYKVTTTFPSRPVAFLAFDILLGELDRAKAGPKEYEKYVEAMSEGVAPFGPHLQLGRSLQLANVFRANPKLAPLALARSREAVKLLSEQTPVTLQLSAQLGLAESLVANDKKDDADKMAPAVRKLVDDIIGKQKTDSGKLLATQAATVTLLRSPTAAVADLGLAYARKAVEMVKKDAPLAQRAGVRRLLLSALTQRGKKDTKEAKEVAAELEKMEPVLDEEFAKAIAFEVKPFGKKKSESKRVVLVELFNMVHDPGTWAAEAAYDAAGRRYGKEVALLQYQCHILRPAPIGNPLANGDAVERQKFYDDDVKQAGTVVVDGKVAPQLRGAPGPDKEKALNLAKDRFEKLEEALDKQVEVVDEATVKLEVKRKGDELEMAAEVSGLKEAGPKMKLRFALVEDVVRFQGNNGYRLHTNVVRAMPGGAAGTALKTKDSTTTVKLDLGDLRKVLASHQKEFTTKARVPLPPGPLELKKLKVIAFVQDDDSKRVLQAVQAAVPTK